MKKAKKLFQKGPKRANVFLFVVNRKEKGQKISKIHRQRNIAEV